MGELHDCVAVLFCEIDGHESFSGWPYGADAIPSEGDALGSDIGELAGMRAFLVLEGIFAAGAENMGAVFHIGAGLGEKFLGGEDFVNSGERGFEGALDHDAAAHVRGEIVDAVSPAVIKILGVGFGGDIFVEKMHEGGFALGGQGDVHVAAIGPGEFDELVGDELEKFAGYYIIVVAGEGVIAAFAEIYFDGFGLAAAGAKKHAGADGFVDFIGSGVEGAFYFYGIAVENGHDD